MRICLSPSEANAVDSKAASIGLSTTEMGREAVIDASEREIDAPTLLADILGEVAKLKKGETFTARSMAVKCHPKRNNWAYTMTASGPRPNTLASVGRMLGAKDRQNANAYRFSRVEEGVSVYEKL